MPVIAKGKLNIPTLSGELEDHGIVRRPQGSTELQKDGATRRLKVVLQGEVTSLLETSRYSCLEDRRCFRQRRLCALLQNMFMNGSPKGIDSETLSKEPLLCPFPSHCTSTCPLGQGRSPWAPGIFPARRWIGGWRSWLGWCLLTGCREGCACGCCLTEQRCYWEMALKIAFSGSDTDALCDLWQIA